jgi:hypothetical protein
VLCPAAASRPGGGSCLAPQVPQWCLLPRCCAAAAALLRRQLLLLRWQCQPAS